MSVRLLWYIWITALLGIRAITTDVDDDTCLMQRSIEYQRKYLLGVEESPQCKRAQDNILVPAGATLSLRTHLALDEAREPAEYKKALHQNRTGEFEALSAHPLGLIFYGDSITEQWRETCVGKPCPSDIYGGAIIQDVTGNQQTFNSLFVQQFGPSAIMAVGADTSADLLWRLQHGEAPVRKSRAVVMHIGINDINEMGATCFLNEKASANICDTRNPERLIQKEQISDADAEDIANNVYLGIEAVLQEVSRSCQTPIVLTGLLPTGYKWPEGPYGQIIPRVNSKLSALAATNSKSLKVIDCSGAVLKTTSSAIDASLMPDFLHPSPRGMARWAACISSAVQDV